jgi:hypothetical protein
VVKVEAGVLIKHPEGLDPPQVGGPLEAEGVALDVVLRPKTSHGWSHCEIFNACMHV